MHHNTQFANQAEIDKVKAIRAREAKLTAKPRQAASAAKRVFIIHSFRRGTRLISQCCRHAINAACVCNSLQV